MQRFLQFLHERFYKSFDGRFGYVEVYKNPTITELEEMSKGNNWRQLGAIATDKDLYVWDRQEGEHDEVKRTISGLPPRWVPLYLYYKHSTRSCEVLLSRYSAAKVGLEYDEDELVAFCKAHPAFKIFSNIRAY